MQSRYIRLFASIMFVFLLGIVTRTCIAEASSEASSQTPSTEEMWEIIQQQQKTITDLQTRLTTAERHLATSEQKVEAVADAIEVTADAVEGYATTTGGYGGSDTAIGGYGELHYNNQDGDDEIDFHRFVLFFGHEFTDRIRFFSELELEHALAGEGKDGEVELEQAYIEMDINDRHRLRTGVDILPVGLVGYIHEPHTFYGIERPEVETRIIPGAWWEAGIGLNGELAAGWSYDAVLHSGLAVKSNIRSGRQKVSQADADHPAVTGRLRYTGIPGLALSGTLQYQSDITAGVSSNSATLLEGNVDWKHANGFAFRALYARWDLQRGVIAERGLIAGSDQQYGYYVEPAYRFGMPRSLGEAGVFARWSKLDYVAGSFGSPEAPKMPRIKEERRISLGVNYWPSDTVVFKFDWVHEDDERGNTSRQGFNLGLGYEF